MYIALEARPLGVEVVYIIGDWYWNLDVDIHHRFSVNIIYYSMLSNITFLIFENPYLGLRAFRLKATGGARMVDLWNIPKSSINGDIITARVAEAIRYSISLLEQMQPNNAYVRKNIITDMTISKDTLRTYTYPIVDENYRLIVGPIKIALFHGMIHSLGVRTSQFYEAAETCLTYCEFISRISHIVLTANALQNEASSSRNNKLASFRLLKNE